MATNGFDLGTAWVQISPSMKGVKKAVEKELGDVDTGRASKGWASDISSGVGNAFKSVGGIGVAAIGAVGAAIGTLAVGGGINRALAIEGAQAKLTGLGHSAESVTKIMGSALDSVKGTAFGLGDAATVAAGLVASGVQSGTELTGVLKTVADTAQISGRSLTDVGQIFGSVAAKGKLQGDDLLQLSAAGIPVLQFLGQQLGITSGEVSALASKGEIDFATFASAMEAGLGGAALSAGETFTGAWANVNAALGRGGALIATPVLEGLRVVFVALIPAIDGMNKALEPFAGALGERVASVAQNIADALGRIQFDGINLSGFDGLSSVLLLLGPAASLLAPLLEAIPIIGKGLGGAVGALGGPVGLIIGFVAQMLVESQTLRESLGGLFSSFGPVLSSLAPVIQTVAGAMAQLAQLVGDALGQAIMLVTPILSQLMGILGTVFGEVLGIVIPIVMDLVSVALPLFMTVLQAILPLISSLMGALMPLISAILPPLGQLLGFVAGIVGGVLQVAFSILVPIITGLVDVLVGLLVPALDWLAATIPVVIDWFSGLFTGTNDAGKGVQDVWGGFVGFFQGVWDGITAVFNWAWNSVLKPVIDGIGAAFTWLSTYVIGPVVAAISWYINSVLVPAFQFVWGIVSFVFQAISSIIQISWGVIAFVFGAIVSAVQNVLGAAFVWLQVNVIQPVWRGIQAAIFAVYSWFMTTLVPAWNVILAVFGAVFTWININVIQPVWRGIQSAIFAVYSWFMTTLVPAWNAVLAVFGAAFAWVRINVIEPVWRGIRDAAWNVYNWYNGTLVPIFRSAIDNIGSAFNTVKDTIGKAWDAIKTAAMAPVKFVVESVYRDGIKKLFDDMASAVGLDTRMPDPPSLAFAAGGVLPGYTPGRDVHNFYSPTGGRLALSGGEGIIRPDALRALGGKGWLDAVNGSRGSAGKVGHFANGGIWDDLGSGVGDVVGWISGAVENVSKIFTDPGGAVNALIREPVKALLEGMGGGKLGDIIAGVPLKAIDGIVEWAKNTIKPPASSGAVGDYMGGITLQRLLPYIAASGTMITDTYRDPAYNAAVGGSPSSYHMDKANPAVDVSGSSAAMWSFYRMVMGDPGGWRQVLWQVAGHYDHVHVANQGGVFGQLPTFDNGGWMEPGFAYNGSNSPEPVFTNSQWDTLKANVGGGAPSALHVYDVDGVLMGTMQVAATGAVQSNENDRQRLVMAGGSARV